MNGTLWYFAELNSQRGWFIPRVLQFSNYNFLGFRNDKIPIIYLYIYIHFFYICLDVLPHQAIGLAPNRYVTLRFQVVVDLVLEEGPREELATRRTRRG